MLLTGGFALGFRCAVSGLNDNLQQMLFADIGAGLAAEFTAGIGAALATTFVAAGQPHFDRVGKQFFPVQAVAVIGVFDHQCGALLNHRDVDAPGGLLAGLFALFGGFDAMLDGVTNHLLKRRHHEIHYLPVCFDIAAVEG